MAFLNRKRESLTIRPFDQSRITVYDLKRTRLGVSTDVLNPDWSWDGVNGHLYVSSHDGPGPSLGSVCCCVFPRNWDD